MEGIIEMKRIQRPMPKKSNNQKTKNKKQLAGEYGVNIKTFDKMLEPLIKEMKKLKGITIFSPKQIKFIYEELGNPND